ncbi:MAG: hypothetical protein V3T86_15725 [Planctomycetota bacterium]
MEASDETKNQIDKVIGDLSVRYGHDSSLLDRLRPVVERVFAARVEADTREELIALVEETYATHSRLRQSMADVRQRLRLKVNEAYGRMLGIEPPRV